jgi:membrane protein
MTADGAWSVPTQRRWGRDRLRDLRRFAARLHPILALRSMRRFRRIGGRDRALILAGQAFTTLIPVMILAAGVVGRSRGSALAEGFVNRFRLGGGSADAVRLLFTRPPNATGTMSVVGFAVLLVSLLGFTRSLQGTYEAAWDLSPRGLRGTLNGLGGMGLLVAQMIALGAVMSVLRGLPALPLLGTLARIAAGFPLWLILQHLLLSRRVPMRALWPGALVTAVAQGLVVLGSGAWMPALMARNEARYGVIGVTFALLTWLIILAFAIVIAAVVGAEVGSTTGRADVASTHPDTPVGAPGTPGPGGSGG